MFLCHKRLRCGLFNIGTLVCVGDVAVSLSRGLTGSFVCLFACDCDSEPCDYGCNSGEAEAEAEALEDLQGRGAGGVVDE